MIARTAKYYLIRKKIIPSRRTNGQYASGLIQSHTRPVSRNEALTAPETPGTKVVTQV